MKSPDDVGGVFNIAGFFEAVERNGLDIVVAVERTDDDKSRISVALKFFENDRSLLFIKAEGFKQEKQVVNRFVLKLQDLQVGLRASDLVNDEIKISRPSPATNIGGSK